jgi:hypothetical protein
MKPSQNSLFKATTSVRSVAESRILGLVLGKYQWREIQWKSDLRRKKTLIVTGPNKAPSSAGIVKRFPYPQVPIVLSVKEQIAQYPWQEDAYVLIATREKPAPKL